MLVIRFRYRILHVLRVVRALEVSWDARVEPWRPHPSWCEPMLQGGKYYAGSVFVEGGHQWGPGSDGGPTAGAGLGPGVQKASTCQGSLGPGVQKASTHFLHCGLAMTFVKSPLLTFFLPVLLGGQ